MQAVLAIATIGERCPKADVYWLIKRQALSMADSLPSFRSGVVMHKRILAQIEIALVMLGSFPPNILSME